MLNWTTILRNIFSNWASYLVTAVVGFILAPFIVHSLGNTGYGLWTLVISLTGYFGMLDLGIRSSVGRFVARHIALNEEDQVNRIINTSFTLLAAGGMLALIGSIVIATYFFGVFKVEPQFVFAGKAALMILGLNIACTLPLGVFSAVLVGLERYDVIGATTIVGELLRAVLVMVFLKLGFGLVALALVTLFIGAAEYTVMALLVRSLYRPLRLGWRFVDLSTLKGLSSFGIFRFIWIVSNQVIFYSDSVVIGIYLGASAITHFAIAGSLVNYGRNLVSLLTDAFFPAATRMDAKDDLSGLQQLLILGTRISLLISLPLCLGFVFLGKQFIGLWMGKEYFSSAAILIVLTIPQFASMSLYVSTLVLTSMARHRVLAYLALAEGVTNLVLSVVLVRRIGLIGVAWGTVIPHLIITGLILPLYTMRTLRMNLADFLRGAYLRPVLCAIPAAGLCYAFSVWFQNPTWLHFGAEVSAVCAVFLIASYRFCLTPGQHALLLHILQRLIHRQAVIHEA